MRRHVSVHSEAHKHTHAHTRTHTHKHTHAQTAVHAIATNKSHVCKRTQLELDLDAMVAAASAAYTMVLQ